MKLIKTPSAEHTTIAIVIAQHIDTGECLGYSEHGIEYSGSVSGFKQRYRPGDIEFETLGDLKADFQAWLESELPARIEQHCAALTAERDRRDKDPQSTIEAHGTTWQTGPDDLAKLNDTLTTYTALGGTPEGFKWWDINNVAHDADVTYLAQIAAADAQRQYSNFIQCVTLKTQARALPIEPGSLSKLNAIQWPDAE